MTVQGYLLVLGLTNAALLLLLLLRTASGGGERAVRDELRVSRDDDAKRARELRAEVADGMKASADTLVKAVGELGALQQGQLDSFATRLRVLSESLGVSLDGFRATLEMKLDGTRDQATRDARDLRDELALALKGSTDSVAKQLSGVVETTQSKLDTVRATVDVQLQAIKDSTAAGLQDIRKTVDEQLQTTLERRLTESFKVVSDHLEHVHRGLGEMKSLATGVGDLQRVLTNVKARGTWAEYQLEAILQEILTPTQYDKNVATRPDSDRRVEFAVRLPGRTADPARCVWLPIDSKFPQEAYLRLLAASDAADAEGVKAAVTELAQAVKIQAQAIRDKYLAPPDTTDFAILFVPTEGLYAELLRVPALAQELQQTYRVLVAGPTTLAALLNSLRMGFQTLAIERSASDVWAVLGAVKHEFGKFGGVLSKLRKQLDTATRMIDDADVRTRAMERQLRDVEAHPGVDAQASLALPVLLADGNELSDLEP